MKRVIIVGSPRANGRSAHLAEMLFEANIDERPEDELYLVPISEIDVGPCIGCGACRKESPVTFLDDDGNEVTELRNRCIFDDDMQTLYDLLDEADALTIVCPVYFSGTPGPMKCLLDRLQPYFWPYCANGPRLPKRPLELHIIGEGGDPHGYAPLVSEVRGPTALAGFGLERIFDWVGKISPSGEILEEAEEIELATALRALTDIQKSLVNASSTASENAPDSSAVEENDAAASSSEAQSESTPAKPFNARPKLSLSGGNEKPPAQTKGVAKSRTSAQAKGTSGGKVKSEAKGAANAKTSAQAKGAVSKSQGRPQGKAQGRSQGKAQGQSQGKSQGQSRGQASKQKRGRSGGKGGHRG